MALQTLAARLTNNCARLSLDSWNIAATPGCRGLKWSVAPPIPTPKDLEGKTPEEQRIIKLFEPIRPHACMDMYTQQQANMPLQQRGSEALKGPNGGRPEGMLQYGARFFETTPYQPIDPDADKTSAYGNQEQLYGVSSKPGRVDRSVNIEAIKQEPHIKPLRSDYYVRTRIPKTPTQTAQTARRSQTVAVEPNFGDTRTSGSGRGGSDQYATNQQTFFVAGSSNQTSRPATEHDVNEGTSIVGDLPYEKQRREHIRNEDELDNEVPHHNRRSDFATNMQVSWGGILSATQTARSTRDEQNTVYDKTSQDKARLRKKNPEDDETRGRIS